MLFWFMCLIWFCYFHCVVAIFGGHLLCVKSSSTIAFYEWESLELIRRIEINPKLVRNKCKYLNAIIFIYNNVNEYIIYIHFHVFLIV